MSKATACLNTKHDSANSTTSPPAATLTLPGANAPVPKEYAHLRTTDSLVLESWVRRAPDVFALTAHWPASTDQLPYSPQMLTQIIRQSGLVIAHAEYDLPLSHQTLLSELNYRVTPNFRVPHDRSLPLIVEVLVSEAKRKGRTVGTLSMNINIFHEGIAVARAYSQFSCVSPRAYQRLRGDHHTVDWANWAVPPPVDAASVGRSAAIDVVLAPSGTPGRWQLRNDVSNTLLFDHPVDHVPGLVLVEAAHQAAHALGAPGSFEPYSVASGFERYIEFDEPCWIEAHATSDPDSPQATVLVTGTQSNHSAFQIELTGSYRQ